MPALPHPRRRRILLLLAGLGVALAAVAANPHTVLLTRQLQPVTAEHERNIDLYGEVVEFTTNGNGGTTRVQARAYLNHNDDYRIRVAVYRPDPRLHAIDVRFRIPGAPLPYNALLLESSSGDWPPVTNGATDAGGLRFAVDGLNGGPARVDFYLLADRLYRCRPSWRWTSPSICAHPRR